MKRKAEELERSADEITAQLRVISGRLKKLMDGKDIPREDHALLNLKLRDALLNYKDLMKESEELVTAVVEDSIATEKRIKPEELSGLVLGPTAYVESAESLYTPDWVCEQLPRFSNRTYKNICPSDLFWGSCSIPHCTLDKICKPMNDKDTRFQCDKGESCPDVHIRTPCYWSARGGACMCFGGPLGPNSPTTLMHERQVTLSVWKDICLACRLSDAHERGVYGVAQRHKAEIRLVREENDLGMEQDRPDHESDWVDAQDTIG